MEVASTRLSLSHRPGPAHHDHLGKLGKVKFGSVGDPLTLSPFERTDAACINIMLEPISFIKFGCARSQGMSRF